MALNTTDALKNNGLLVLNRPAVPAAEKTVVVLGTARSGTTMVAGVLQALGVPMGEKLGPVLEDVAISTALESGDVARFEALVGRRNAQYPLWGWKRPAAVDSVGTWLPRVRAPYVVAVFRDPFAIANRNRISMLTDVFPNMAQAIQHLGKLVDVLRGLDCPLLLCSYEKVLADPIAFVRSVDDFLGLDVPARHNEAVRQIEPAPSAYLENSRVTQGQGHLDTADARHCGGWAFYTQRPQQPASVEVLVNDRLVGTVVADQLRRDVQDLGLHPSGRCGFSYAWPAGSAPQPGDRVAARVVGDVRSLAGSPKLVEAPRTASPARDFAAATGLRPAFLGIGAKRAASTWLYEMLRQHPQIHLSDTKELHFWTANKDKPISWYQGHFVAGRLNGDITPAYAILPDAAIAEIRTFAPDARLFLSMRHPVERAWSSVQMYIEQTFAQCPPDIAAGTPTAEHLALLRERLFHPGCLARSHYAQTIRRWRRHFPREALLCFRYERIRDEPRALLAELCRHLGASPDWAAGLPDEALRGTVFASPRLPFPAALRAEFQARCAPLIDEVERLLDMPLGDWRDGAST